MELFLIYLVTRLTELKSGLGTILVATGILLTIAVVVRLFNEFFTSAETKDRPVEDQSHDRDVFIYHGIRRTTRRGLWMFAPVFVVTLFINMLLPTTRDAVVIAGGYGLVEAVKNERVQRLFSKSAQVASQWLDEQLNGESKDEAKKSPQAAEKPAEKASN